MDNRAIWRGKRIDTGDWVQGYYCKMIVNTARSGAMLLDAIQQVVSDCEIHSIEVDPSTLGRCTGLRDKHGKSIFEGDVVEWDGHRGRKRNGIIIWKNAAFVINIDGYSVECLLNHITEIEAIGNIHDNPSLLKGVEAECPADTHQEQ